MTPSKSPYDPSVAIGPHLSTWHALLTAGGLFVGVRLLAPRATLDIAWSVGLAGAASGLVGARLFPVIDYWADYARDPGTILNLSSRRFTARCGSR